MNKTVVTSIIFAGILSIALIVVAAARAQDNPFSDQDSASPPDLLYALLNPSGQTHHTISDFQFPAVARDDIWKYIIGQMPVPPSSPPVVVPVVAVDALHNADTTDVITSITSNQPFLQTNQDESNSVEVTN